jgi:ABC-type enterochelin transport system permease subunit
MTPTVKYYVRRIIFVIGVFLIVIGSAFLFPIMWLGLIAVMQQLENYPTYAPDTTIIANILLGWTFIVPGICCLWLAKQM